MFFHNFKYTLKNLFKNKTLIFWTFMFPIILGTFFYLAFHDIEKNETLDKFQIAIVDIEKNPSTKILQEAFLNTSDVIDVLIKEENDAKELLEKNEIIGYVLLENTPHVIVNKNGIYETVLKTIVETIVYKISMAETLIKEKINETIAQSGTIEEELIKDIKSEITSLLENEKFAIKDTSPNNISYTMIEFYTLIAMMCLYGGILTMTCINSNLANMSDTGKRISITPVKKSYLILSSLSASFIVQLIGLILLFGYTSVILQIDYGTKFFHIFLLGLIGSIAGMSLGLCLAATLKKNENIKQGLLLAITMIGCFFSGMMGITMKYVIDKNIPIINIINPASMITDGFYALYYYETNNRYLFNIISLLLFSAVLLIISTHNIRRQTYDSI